ncbi:hypothetical protein PMAYCL1PPCAC_12540, partial [Pristionchus mayeri]
SDHPEDGECSSSPKRPEVVEILDCGTSFVLDRNDDASMEDDIVLNTSDMKTKEENDDEKEHVSLREHKNIIRRNNWLTFTTARVMTINNEEPKTEELRRKDNRRKPQCFNCLGDHNMVNCPEPKNYNRIRENRDAFQEARSKDSRYTESQPVLNGEFKPGRLSDKLQRALGIGPNDIPEFVYRMRKMGFVKGYPPGYLKNAVVKQMNPDDLLTFHSDNPELKGDSVEEEERSLSPTINSDKIIYYFGFNQTYRALRDKEQFRVPPFSDYVSCLNDHVKKEFREEMKRERKRKAIPLERDDDKRAKQDEDDDDRLILEAPPPPPVIDVGMEDKKVEVDVDEKGDTLLNESSIASPSPSTNGTPKSRRVSLGTPVLQRKNLGDGMKKTPSLDAFAKGIIPFQVEEPTPRTGFLQKMLKKIKGKLS